MSELQDTVHTLTVSGKGLLAADESTNSAKKRLEAVGVESTEETRRQYRNLMLSTKGFEQFISGVILFDETISQKTDEGVLFPEHLKNLGIVPGIKVDGGLEPFDGSEIEQQTKGLEDLRERLQKYKGICKFTKWRCVYHITDATPTDVLIKKNAETLAEYAKICQEEGFVPIPEPEVLIDGDHTIDQCDLVSRNVWTTLFTVFEQKGVSLPEMLLKTSMVITGKDCPNKANPQEVADRTVEAFKDCIPQDIGGIVFLSGGQSPEDATVHLNEIHKMDALPWAVSFSYARALQGPALEIWKGNPDNVPAAQEKFLEMCKNNSLATKGEFE